MKTYRVYEREFIEHYLIEDHPTYYMIWDIEDGEIEVIEIEEDNSFKLKSIRFCRKGQNLTLSEAIALAENEGNEIDTELENYFDKTIQNIPKYCSEMKIEQFLTHKTKIIRDFIQYLIAKENEK